MMVLDILKLSKYYKNHILIHSKNNKNWLYSRLFLKNSDKYDFYPQGPHDLKRYTGQWTKVIIYFKNTYNNINL